MGDLEAGTQVTVESLLGYHPLHARDLTLGLTKPGTVPGGQFDWGGRLRKSNEASKGSLSADRNRAKSIKAEGSLTARLTGRAGTKVGLSDPVE